jgi:Zn-dependent peptidase ImmA (M78 family)
MEAPHFVEVLGIMVPVHLKNYGPEDYTFGEWDSCELSITLNPTIPPEHQKVTLLHELIHGVDDMLDLGLSHKTVYCLSQAMLTIIRHNPGLVKWVEDPTQAKPVRESAVEPESPRPSEKSDCQQ